MLYLSGMASHITDTDDDSDSPWFAWDEAEDVVSPSLKGQSGRNWIDPWLNAARTPDVAAALVEAAEQQAKLAARLTYDQRIAGAAVRLAYQETADAMWLAGDAGARDRLALYAHGLRPAVDTRDLLADWALRQLQGTGDPSRMTVPQLRSFLGLVSQKDSAPAKWTEDQVELFGRPMGDELDLALSEWLACASQVAGQHRLVRAVILHRAWRWLGLGAVEDPVSSVVVACRIAAEKDTSFAPLSGAVRQLRTFARGGSEAVRLIAMLNAFSEAARAALLAVERQALWNQRAADAAETKAEHAIVRALGTQPMVSSKAVAHQSAMTPQAINGAARSLLARDLISEMTGQSRFRLWQAAF